MIEISFCQPLRIEFQNKLSCIYQEKHKKMTWKCFGENNYKKIQKEQSKDQALQEVNTNWTYLRITKRESAFAWTQFMFKLKNK